MSFSVLSQKLHTTILQGKRYMLWVEIWNLYVYHVYIQWFEKTGLRHVYIAPFDSCRCVFDHLIICFIYCMNINTNSVCIGFSLQHLHSLPPRSRTHCLSWHLLQPKQAELDQQNIYLWTSDTLISIGATWARVWYLSYKAILCDARRRFWIFHFTL